MDASILTLTWPNDFDMSDLKRFETEARTRRYQALGRACRDQSIQALMVAHHGDDQAETVMMRLANNRLRTGLKGMQSAEWIPECEGIHGVYHSGKKQRPDTSLDIPFPIEQGGIRILRPLLAIEKARLVATCTEQGVKWAEDQSNHVHTLTSRNAIRHIYQNHTLPKALSIHSLVDTSLYMQKRVAEHHAFADFLYDQCLLKLDIQTGSLLVRFPPFSSLLPRDIVTDSDKNEARNNAYCLIEKVADLVTPKFKPALGQLAARIDSIYPEFLTPEEKEGLKAAGEGHFVDNFTVHHVWWRRWDKTSPFEDDGLANGDCGASVPHRMEWLLTRQTLEHHEGPRLQLIIPPVSTSSVDVELLSKSREVYQLFDGRFWIKIQNYTSDNLILRHFEHADMRHLPMTQKNRDDRRNYNGVIPERFILAAFALLKPSEIRFTLPAIFQKDSLTGEEIFIGLPTLDVRMNGLGPPRGICDWSVRYKKVKFGHRSAVDIIVPGIKRFDIIEQEKRLRMANKGVTRLKIRRSQVDGADDAQDTFAGYQRVLLPVIDEKRKPNDVKSRNRKKKMRLSRTQRAIEGGEMDGPSVLEAESKSQGRK